MRILNFGSLNLDFVYQVAHFVRPGETLSSEELSTFPGGKGLNQSVALSRAGAEVFHAGCVGEDGGLLLDTLREAGVSCRYVRQLAGARTGHAVIQVDQSGQNCILLFGGANQMVGEEMIEAVLKDFAPGDWLLLQNEISALPTLLRRAGEKGLRVAFNPSPITPALPHFPLENVEFFLLNEVEGAALGGGGTPEETLNGLRARFPRAKIVLTLGGDGAVCWDGAQLWRQGIFPVEAVDTTAAGDTFTGYFLTAVGEGLDAGTALRRANAAAAIAVSRKGAAPSIPEKAEVEAFLAARGC